MAGMPAQDFRMSRRSSGLVTSAFRYSEFCATAVGPFAGRASCRERCRDPFAPRGGRQRVLPDSDQAEVAATPGVEQLAEAREKQTLGQVSTRSENNESSYAISHSPRVAPVAGAKMG